MLKNTLRTLVRSVFDKFKKLYKKVIKFLNEKYGNSAAFEHGIVGQTVFHAHMHFLPFYGVITDILPKNCIKKKFKSLDEIKKEFNKNKKYLYISAERNKYLIKTSIAYPRFFRDKFAKFFWGKEKGDWKKAKQNKNLVNNFKKDVKNLKKKFNSWQKTKNL